MPKTASPIAMSSRTWAVNGSSALRTIRTQRQAKGAAATAHTTSPPTRPMRLVWSNAPSSPRPALAGDPSGKTLYS
jgi:hypothetical protein